MTTFNIEPSARIKRLPPYLMAGLNALKHKKRQQGIDIIDLGMGNPLDPTPDVIVDKLCQAAHDPRNHRYSVNQPLRYGSRMCHDLRSSLRNELDAAGR